MTHDPGGKVRIGLPDGVGGDAVFSACRRYRYTLERWSGERHADCALWVGMNPSTAEALVDDPTVRREWNFTKRFGLNRMVKCNVSPYRATNPADVVDAPAACDVNLSIIEWLASDATMIVLAHGVVPKVLEPWRDRLHDRLRRRADKVFCLGRTKGGDPRHPLYLRKDAVAELFFPNHGD